RSRRVPAFAGMTKGRSALRRAAPVAPAPLAPAPLTLAAVAGRALARRLWRAPLAVAPVAGLAPLAAAAAALSGKMPGVDKHRLGGGIGVLEPGLGRAHHQRQIL